MKPEDLDIEGTIIYWNLNSVNIDKFPFEQLDELKEDLAQVELADRLLLDIGWYPEFSEDGKFVVTVVHNQEWDSPVFRDSDNEFQGLKKMIFNATRQRKLGSAKQKPGSE